MFRYNFLPLWPLIKSPQKRRQKCFCCGCCHIPGHGGDAPGCEVEDIDVFPGHGSDKVVPHLVDDGGRRLSGRDPGVDKNQGGLALRVLVFSSTGLAKKPIA